MLRDKPYYLASVALALCFAGSAVAQTDYNWSALGDGTSWSDPANWVGGVVPLTDGTTHAIFLGTGYPTTTPTPITIGASDTVQTTDQLFGPEWGETLNIYGTLNLGFGFAPVGDVANNYQSVVNLYGNASMTSGDSIFIGDMFWFDGGPNVIVNMYDNSQMSANYLAVGGHLNIFGGTVTVGAGLLTGTPTAGAWGSPLSTDSTRLLDIAGGELRVVGDASAQMTDLISRGVLEGYGVVGNVNVDTVSLPGWTIVTAAPEPGSLALFGVGGLVLLLRRRRS